MKTNFRVSEELNRNIHIEQETTDIESNTESQEKSIERTNDRVYEEEPIENMVGGPLLSIDESNIELYFHFEPEPERTRTSKSRSTLC